MSSLLKEYEEAIDEAIASHDALTKLGYPNEHIFFGVRHEIRTGQLAIMTVLRLPDGFEFTVVCGKVISETHVGDIEVRWAERIEEWNKSGQAEREALWRKSRIANHASQFALALVTKRFEFDQVSTNPPRAHA